MVYNNDYFRHDKDRASFASLKSLTWLRDLSKKYLSDDMERDFYLLNLMDNVRMNEKDFPEIHSYLDLACAVFDLPKPAIFLDTCPDAHVISLGQKNPVIVISNTMLELLEPDELKALIGHEMGHVACEHTFYKLIAENLSGLTAGLSVIPGLGAISLAARIPLFDWFRKADLSADRAALLLCDGDVDVVVSMIAKIAGGSRAIAGQVSPESLQQQCEEIEEILQQMKDGSFSDKMSYWFSTVVLNGMMQQHPWPPVRIAAIKEWAASSSAKSLLCGELPLSTVSEEPESSSPSALKNLGDSLNEAKDNLMFWKK